MSALKLWLTVTLATKTLSDLFGRFRMVSDRFRIVSDLFGRFRTVFGLFRTVSDRFRTVSDRFRTVSDRFRTVNDDSIPNFKISNFNWPGLGHRRGRPPFRPSGPTAVPRPAPALAN